MPLLMLCEDCNTVLAPREFVICARCERTKPFAFDVFGSTHDLLKQGVTEPFRHRVIVAPAGGVSREADRHEAAEIACQMVACRGQMPTALYDRI